jgi:DNA-binding transcriptional LysR family regulator
VPTGKLRVSAPVSFGVNALASLLPEYMTMYPDIKVEMSLTNRTVDLIDEGFDVAFRVGNLSDSGLIARALRPYKLVLCAAPHYILEHPTISEPTDLLEHECLGFSHTELRTHWTFLTESGPMSVPVSGRLMVDSGEALMKAAIAGLGVMLQPLELVEKEMETGRLVEVLTNYPVPTRPMHLLYVPDRRMTPKLRSFIDFTLSHFGS